MKVQTLVQEESLKKNLMFQTNGCKTDFKNLENKKLKINYLLRDKKWLFDYRFKEQEYLSRYLNLPL